MLRLDPDSASKAIADRQIVGSPAIAKAAIPRCGISFITGEQSKAILKDYFAVMKESNPASLGGAIPMMLSLFAVTEMRKIIDEPDVFSGSLYFLFGFTDTHSLV